ncbi:hypothetical protein VCSRO188_0017 [Vibrio cholerae]|nr:hypothetical protein VCSRO188_0017 [Vibrio cholerae]
MDIEKRPKALRLLLSRSLWIAARVGIVLVTKSIYQASVTNRPHDKTRRGARYGDIKGNKKPSHDGEGYRKGWLIGLTREETGD